MNNILVIDDDPEILEVVDMLLSTKGLRVKTESRWEQAFNEIESFEPDVILLDVDLGNEDGRIITKKIKSFNSTSHIPVILLSGIEGMSNKLNDCFNDDFISKPFDSQILLDKIELLLCNISLRGSQDKDCQALQMMENNSLISFDFLYNKYAASLFGYILSAVKNKEKSEEILIKVFTEIADNPKICQKKSFLLKCIRIANKSIMETSEHERQTLLAVFNNYKAIQNN